MRRGSPARPRVVGGRYCFVEAYGTPFVHPWTDGADAWPSEWYWRRGRLTTDRDGAREFPYLHFMVWKGGHEARFGGGQWRRLARVVNLAPEDAREGFRVNERGFFPL
jgi:hypothetical protein